MKPRLTKHGPRRALPVLAVVAAALLVESLNALIGTRSGQALSQVDVSATRLVCPVSPTSNAAADFSVAGFPVGDDAATSTDDDAVITTAIINEQQEVFGKIPAALTGVGGALSSTFGPTSAPLLVEGAGRLAAATSAGITNIARSGDDRGLATIPCSQAATSWWFVGGQSTLGKLTRLVITNPDLAPATFDVSVYNNKGQVDAPAGRGLTVAANSRVEVRLDALSPDSAATVLHVRSISGRVHAAVLLRGVDGLTPLGSEWLPATIPATRILIPIPAGLTNIDAHFLARRKAPSDLSLVVRTPTGVFTPAGAEGLTLGADSVVSLPMDDALSEGGVLEVTSDVGIVAGITATKSGSGLTDIVSYGSAPAIRGLAVATGLRSQSTLDLALTSWDTNAEVSVQTISADGSLTSEQVQVTNDSLTEVNLKASDSGPTTIFINAPVSVAASLTSVIQASEGVLATAQTLEHRATSVLAPRARLVVGIDSRR